MDENEAMKRWLAGELLLVGEYRMHKIDHIKWRDETTGKSLEADILRHTIEIGPMSIAVQERIADGTDVSKVVVPFVKGQRVLWHVENMTAARGLVSGRGLLEVLQVSGDVGAGKRPGLSPASPGQGGSR